MKKFNLREKLEEFIGLLKSGKIEVYNEFSFQHELGYFLRNHLKQNPGDFKIQFERDFCCRGIGECKEGLGEGLKT